MIIGYKVLYAWSKYPNDTLAIHKKYAKTKERAQELFEDIIQKHYHLVQIVPIVKKVKVESS